jgi:peptidoglycan/LPS O-acetylase OafA/YrhL
VFSLTIAHNSTSSVPARLDFLDGLRGVAALGVVVHHYLGAFYPTTLTGHLATTHFWATGERVIAVTPLLLNFRVCLFFVLSGLVLAESAARSSRGWRTLLAHLVRRYIRLGVPVAVTVFAAYVLLRTHSFYNQQLATASSADWMAECWRWMPTFRQFVGDALFGVLTRGETLYNPALWTMVIEWRSSVLALVVLVLTARSTWRLLLYLALVLACTLGPLNFYNLAFVLGMSLHDAYQRAWPHWLMDSARRWLIVGLLLFMVVLACYPETEYQISVLGPPYAWLHLPGVSHERMADLCHTLGAGALLAALLLSQRLQQLTGSPGLRAMGKRAFSLYLIHFLLLGTVSAWLFVRLLRQYSYHVSFGLTVAFSTLVLVGLTEAFYRWVDIPSHALARWIGRGVEAQLARPAAYYRRRSVTKL